jgi:CelD/BcsL family acetyltransferase involved in cellulose biosynthesis
MSAADIRSHLRVLQLERLEAESTGLTNNRIYMADLESEQVEYQQALVDAAIEEVLKLRSDLSRRQYG